MGTVSPTYAVTQDLEVTVAPGSFALSKSLPFGDFVVENGERYGLDKVGHVAGSQWGEQRITLITHEGGVLRFISHAGADQTPDDFAFAAVAKPLAYAWLESERLTLKGFEGALPFTLRRAEYRVDDGYWSDAPTLLKAGQTLQLRVLTAGYGSTVKASATLGASTAEFLASAADTDPDPFSFTAMTGVALNSYVTSNSVTIAGIDMAAPISVSGGEYSINSGSYTCASGTVYNGDSVRVRVYSSGSYSTMTSATLTIGSVSATFNVTTTSYSGGGGGGGGGYGGGGSAGGLALLLGLLVAAHRRLRR